MSFIDKCFETVITKFVLKHHQIMTVEKKTLILSLPYLEDIYVQTRTNLMKFLKGILNYRKLTNYFQILRETH